jgi:hypothetical protein
MKNMLWLVIPLIALVVGIVWAYLSSRPARPAAMQDSMETFSRFRAALATDLTSPAAKPARPGSVGNATATKSPGLPTGRN